MDADTRSVKTEFGLGILSHEGPGQSSQCSEEPIAYVVRQAERGAAVANVCRQIGGSALRRLRQLKDENWRPKGILANLTLDEPISSTAR